MSTFCIKLSNHIILPLAPMSPQPMSSMYIITMFGFVTSFADALPCVANTDNTTSNIILNCFGQVGVEFLAYQCFGEW